MQVKKYALITVFLTVFLDILGFGLIIPLLPFYAQKFGANAFMIGALMASNAVAQLIFSPIWGRLSDKFGRKPVMMVTVLGSTLAYLLFGLADSILLLFLSRILAGITGATVGVAQSFITDLTTKENRSKVLGQLGAVFGLGFVFGPALSGILATPNIYLATAKYGLDLSYLAKYSFGMPGYVAASLSGINFFMVLFFLPESKAKNEDKKKKFDWVEFNKVIKHPEMIMLFLIQFIAMFSTSNMFATFALFLQEKYGYGVSQSAFMFTYFGLSSVIIQGALVGRAVKKYGDVKLLSFSALCMTLGLGLITYMPNVILMTVVATLIFLGNGFMTPSLTSLISQRARENQTGVTLGVSQSLGSFSRIIGPIWGGYIFNVAGYHYPFVTGCFFSFITILLAMKLAASQEQPKQPEPLPII